MVNEHLNLFGSNPRTHFLLSIKIVLTLNNQPLKLSRHHKPKTEPINLLLYIYSVSENSQTSQQKTQLPIYLF